MYTAGLYVKGAATSMTPWTPETNMNGVRVSQADMDNGSPRVGDMIAGNPDNMEYRWLVAERYFLDNYVLLWGS